MNKKFIEKLAGLIRALREKAKELQLKFGMMTQKQRQIVLVLLILFVSISTSLLLKFARKAPAKVEKKIIAPLVKAEPVYQQDIQMIVQGYGTVRPKIQAEVVPQVSGKVVKVSPNFKDGGFVKAAEPLITIDQRDYELAVQRAEAEVARAEVGLELEKAEAEVSRQEWEQLNPGQEPPSPLVVREPQIRQAETTLEAAKAQLATAILNLERTNVSLPFDGRVISESVDLGQYVNTGQSIGKVYSIEAVEIEVPLEDREIKWFDIPIGTGNPVKRGSEVEIRSEFAGSMHTWHGRVVRTTGEIDVSSRLVSVVVEVSKPFENNNGKPPLMPGMFVELLIKGKILKNTIPVPRYAIHEANQIWTIRNGQLDIKELKIVREDKDYSYVVTGLEDGAVIVLSSLDVVTEGMQLRAEMIESSASVTPVKETD